MKCSHGFTNKKKCRTCCNEYMRQYRTSSPEAREHMRTYNREYGRKRLSDPEKAARRREYGRLYARKRRSDPEYMAKWLEKQRIMRTKKRRERTKWFRAFKKTIACLKCGSVKRLQFHHREIKPDNVSVSLYVCQGRSMRVILAEIAKCDPLCHDCHHKFHTAERRSRRSLINVQ